MCSTASRSHAAPPPSASGSEFGDEIRHTRRQAADQAFCNASFSLGTPVKWPFTKPNKADASKVMATELAPNQPEHADRPGQFAGGDITKAQSVKTAPLHL